MVQGISSIKLASELDETEADISDSDVSHEETTDKIRDAESMISNINNVIIYLVYFGFSSKSFKVK